MLESEHVWSDELLEVYNYCESMHNKKSRLNPPAAGIKGYNIIYMY